MPTALITGCAGQDGTYLTRLLLERGYRVIGTDLVKPSEYAGEFRDLDTTDGAKVSDVIRQVCPGEVYHLAAYHHSSDERPADQSTLERSLRVNTLSLESILSAMVNFTPQARLFYAASSRIFGRASSSPQTEQTPFSPVCAYGISKIAGIHLCRIYRNTSAMFVSVGILYNHESPMRPPVFVTRKLSQAAASASLGFATRTKVQDGSALVDWGAAEDYVRAMADILALPEPDEFIVATGVSHTVRQFAEVAFAHVGLDARDYIEDASGGAVHEPRIPICGDSSKLRERTGWSPRRSLGEIAGAMVDADREILLREMAEPSFGQGGKPGAR